MRPRFKNGPSGHSHEHEHQHEHQHGRDRGEFGFGRHGGPPHRGPRRTRRGDIRLALLSGLSDGPAHGYELIQRLSDRSGGRWKPSPGSVYPTLQLLEEAGFASSSQHDGKRVYAITEAGEVHFQALLRQNLARYETRDSGYDIGVSYLSELPKADAVGLLAHTAR